MLNQPQTPPSLAASKPDVMAADMRHEFRQPQAGWRNWLPVVLFFIGILALVIAAFFVFR